MHIPHLLARLLLIAGAITLLTACGPGPAQAARYEPSSTARLPLTSTAAPTTAPTRSTVTSTPSLTSTLAQTATARPSPTPALVNVPAGRVMAPILLYHHIRDEAAGSGANGPKPTRYDLPLANFRAQMQALAERGYQTITVSQLAETIRSGGALPTKPVVITFDDGYLDTYQNAFPVLQEYGFRGVAYVITQTQEKEKAYGYMQADELKALAAAGWEIGSHSVTHSSLLNTRLGMRNELEKSQKDLEAELGVPIRSFSYPFGIANPWVQERVEEYGYDSAVGLDIFVGQSPKRLYYLSRREVQRGTSLDAFLALLTPGEEELAYLRWLTQTPPTPTPARP